MNDLRWTETQLAQVLRDTAQLRPKFRPLPVADDRRKDHDTRRLLNHALFVKQRVGVDLAAKYCRLMGVRLVDAAKVLPRARHSKSLYN